ncbi:MAG: radical SAM protein [Planctomycetes bacterium]|nr:radical SAM protein [Planctomycetota bacterium]
MPTLLASPPVLSAPARTYVHPAEVAAAIRPGDLKGARVCFVNMPLRETALPNNVPLGPGLLAARVREYGADASIVDLNAYRIQDDLARRRGLKNGRHLLDEEAAGLFERHFARHGEPDLVAFSGLITTLKWQERAAAIVRRLLPETMIVSGNGLATEFKTGLFSWIPELNGVAHSEGDDVILKIALDALHVRRRGLASARAAGLLAPYYLGEWEGQPRFLYDGGRPRNLDILPLPALDLMERDVDGFPVLEVYIRNAIWGGNSANSSAAPFTMDRSLSTVSSRGCPFACKFCYRGQQGERDYGVRSPEAMAAEMRFYHEKYGVDFVGITDDNFMVIPRRIAALPAALGPLIRETGLRWGTHGRLDEAADIRPDARTGRMRHNDIQRVKLMAEAGCVYIGFGAESADAAVLEEMGKGGFILTNGTTRLGGYDFPLTMVEGVKKCKEHGVHGNCTWIMGYPGETLRQLQTSVAFIKWQQDLYTDGVTPGTREWEVAMNSVNRRMFTATAYPGTEMFKHPTVRRLLSENFGVSFDAGSGEPVIDDRLRYYVTELDDATKVLHDQDGRPLNFSAMTMDQFLAARECVDAGRAFDILAM